MARKHVAAWRMFTGLSVVSLVLCIATVVLWVSSRGYLTYLHWAKWAGSQPWDRGRLVGLGSMEGCIMLGCEKIETTPHLSGIVQHGYPDGFGLTRVSLGPLNGLPSPLGGKRYALGWTYRNTPEFRQTAWEARCPAWIAVLAFAMLPAVWTILYFRRRRITGIGLCPACGYDLRATPDRCPECGKAVDLSGTRL